LGDDFGVFIDVDGHDGFPRSYFKAATTF